MFFQSVHIFCSFSLHAPDGHEILFSPMFLLFFQSYIIIVIYFIRSVYIDVSTWTCIETGVADLSIHSSMQL